MLTVVPAREHWRVMRGAEVIADLPTNREAWRLVDQITNHPLSRQEEVHDWSFQQAAAQCAV